MDSKFPLHLRTWIASRTYRVRNRDHGDWQTVFIGVAAPVKLRESERPIGSDVSQYGCLVQTGESFTQHMVSGRDALEALFHAVLAVEAYLIALCVDNEITNLAGTKYDFRHDGLFFGPIGAEYLQHFQSALGNINN